MHCLSHDVIKAKGNLPFKSPLRELGHAVRSSGPLAQVIKKVARDHKHQLEQS